jgi:signal transduction histidine kinase/CheY-like chemotaxis protein
MSEAELQAEIDRLRKRVERERRARQEAEVLAEQGTRLLYERGQQLQLLYSIADACRCADSVEAAMQAALDAVCAYTTWPVGHALLVKSDLQTPLASAKLWHVDDDERFGVFKEVTEKLRLRRGEGLPGQVLESGHPVWICDVTQSGNFPRGPYAWESGVRGAFAIPVIAGQSVVAVLEFFSREPVGRTFEREARDEADRANQAKSEFLSRMSHELRTPLNAIIGFGQLLELDTKISQLHREYVGHILKGGRHLLDLVNEVLDISRIEAGHVHLSPEPVRVTDVLDETLDLIGPLARQRQIPVRRISPIPDGWHVMADRQRLKQVLLNLLSNAVKYNRAGGIVGVECLESEGRMRFKVSDTGAGIPAHQLEQLFTPFERLGAEQGTVEGTGLGLALSKRLAEVMGGIMGVESTPGVGSTFWVELAMTASPLQSSALVAFTDAALLTPNRPQRTILYIEDNISNLQLVEGVCALRPELKLLAAMQARLGVDLATQHRPDLILLDLNLPDMTGHEALMHLRADPRTCDIPVIILSADATPGQLARLISAGARAYLTKPLDILTFLSAIDNAWGAAELAAEVPTNLVGRADGQPWRVANG